MAKINRPSAPQKPTTAPKPAANPQIGGKGERAGNKLNTVDTAGGSTISKGADNSALSAGAAEGKR